LRIYYKNGGEKDFILGEKYLTDSYTKHQSEKSLPQGHPGLFKGLLMGIYPIRTPEEIGDLVLLVFEDSTIGVYDLRSKEIIDCLKHPKRHEFLCWSVCHRPGDDCRVEIAMSVMGQTYLLGYSPVDRRNTIRSECVIKKYLRFELYLNHLHLHIY
jgi:hypothetical protein